MTGYRVVVAVEATPVATLAATTTTTTTTTAASTIAPTTATTSTTIRQSEQWLWLPATLPLLHAGGWALRVSRARGGSLIRPCMESNFDSVWSRYKDLMTYSDTPTPPLALSLSVTLPGAGPNTPVWPSAVQQHGRSKDGPTSCTVFENGKKKRRRRGANGHFGQSNSNGAVLSPPIKSFKKTQLITGENKIKIYGRLR